MATRFSSALTSGLITRRELSAAELDAALAALHTEACTQRLASGTYGTTYRACQVLSSLFHECSNCFVYKRAKKPDRLPKEEASLQAALTTELRRRQSHGFQHVPHFIRSRPDPDPKLTHDVLLFMSDVKPLVLGGKRVGAMWDLAQRRDVAETTWRGLWLQLLGTLADLRDAVPGFQHNDLHPNNVLLSPGPRAHKCTWRRPDGVRLELIGPPILATIIDFGLTSSATRKRPAAAFADCVLIDFHHAAAEIYAHWKFGGSAPAWFREWELFLFRWLGAAALDTSKWDDYFYPQDASVIKQLQARSANLRAGLHDVLSDSYFDAFAQRKGTTPTRDLPAEFAPSPVRRPKAKAKTKAKAKSKSPPRRAKAKKAASPLRRAKRVASPSHRAAPARK